MKVTSQFRKVIVVAGCAGLVCAANVGECQAANATATATAVVVAPLGISNTGELNFGKFMRSDTLAGTVVVNAAGAQSVTGGVTSNATLGASARAATFSITGEPNATYAITYTPSTLTSGANSMTIDPAGFFNSVDVGSVAAGVGTLPGSGPQVLNVGATLDVASGQPSGTYAGTLDVAVNYN